MRNFTTILFLVIAMSVANASRGDGAPDGVIGADPTSAGPLAVRIPPLGR
ncbi:MAG: hypothetical protein R3286_06370 [Gammaproteobacteria bacterium]|nr:hypothetical protein [Gammaproteobacteria bacterium]